MGKENFFKICHFYWKTYKSTHSEIPHNFAVRDGANCDKHFEEFALRQILGQIVDDEVRSRGVIAARVRT